MMSIEIKNKITYKTENKECKECITIFTAELARKLLKDGYTVVDIKPDKNDPERKRTLFVFINEPGLIDRIKNLRSEVKHD